MYPETPEYVVLMYLQAIYIEEAYGVDMSEEINQMLKGDVESFNLLELMPKVDTDYQYIKEYIDIMAISNDGINATVKAEGESGVKNFELVYVDGLWKITGYGEYDESLDQGYAQNKYIKTEDGKTYFIEIIRNNENDEAFSNFLIRDEGPSGNVVFDFASQGIEFIGSPGLSGDDFAYFDANGDGYKELHFFESISYVKNPKSLIIHYINGEFKVVFCDVISIIRYTDFDNDGIDELYGYIYDGGTEFYDFGFEAVYSLKNDKYYLDYDKTVLMYQTKVDEMLNEYSKDVAVPDLDWYVGKAIFANRPDVAERIMDECADAIEAYLDSEANEDSPLKYIPAFDECVKLYKERWKELKQKDGTLAIKTK